MLIFRRMCLCSTRRSPAADNVDLRVRNYHIDNVFINRLLTFLASKALQSVQKDNLIFNICFKRQLGKAAEF